MGYRIVRMTTQDRPSLRELAPSSFHRWLDGAEGHYNDLGLDPWVTNWFLMLSLMPVLILWILAGEE